MPEDMEMMPQMGQSSTDTPDVTKLAFLGAEWINKRIFNVAAKVDMYVDRIVDQGLLQDGFAPFESPITDDILTRLTPDQFRMLYDQEPTIAGKAELLGRMKTLKLPMRELLPDLERPFDVGRARLDNEPADTVSSSEASV